MKPIIVLAFLCIIDKPAVSGVSNRALAFASIFNGDFDNRNQTLQDGDDHDFVQMRMIPVDIVCLRPDPVVLAELDDNNIIRELLLILVKDGIEDTVNLTFYYFTDPTKHKPREYNAGNFSNIKCSDLQTKPGCYASYRVVAKEGFVFGNFPYCGAKVNGVYPRYTCNHQCEAVSSAFPMGVRLTSPAEPYELVITSRKYTLINPPEGYVSPCGPGVDNIAGVTN